MTDEQIKFEDETLKNQLTIAVADIQKGSEFLCTVLLKLNQHSRLLETQNIVFKKESERLGAIIAEKDSVIAGLERELLSYHQRNNMNFHRCSKCKYLICRLMPPLERPRFFCTYKSEFNMAIDRIIKEKNHE